ncbi:TRAP transporter small permease [Haloplanus aerogenes]|uniref:TRAP transporter small permease subunit n=1 Tax=Haloplanus aerogenes TaxID=660522 RepID=A0A3M0CUZ7_9EURY|nr:TRAP transporter small permease subunit [Haloplanus aerogenes]AZH24035.1 TRAP transporter small permease subunit [Haloplanus aerogenes]RMB13192.1 TRAP-type C4-dicarboxylate transport system permease small subunit [Haloplanus aerogenes]
MASLSHYFRTFLDPDRLRETRLGPLERNLELYLGGTLLVVYGLVIGFSVIQRTLTGQQALWAQESAIGMFVWVAWLSVAYVIRNEDHLRFTMVLSGLSNTGRYVVYWIEWLCWIGFAGVVFVYSLPVFGGFLSRGATITGTPVPDAVTYLAVTVGVGLVLFRVIEQILWVTYAFRRGDDITYADGEVVGE